MLGTRALTQPLPIVRFNQTLFECIEPVKADAVARGADGAVDSGAGDAGPFDQPMVHGVPSWRFCGFEKYRHWDEDPCGSTFRQACKEQPERFLEVFDIYFRLNAGYSSILDKHPITGSSGYRQKSMRFS